MQAETFSNLDDLRFIHPEGTLKPTHAIPFQHEQTFVSNYGGHIPREEINNLARARMDEMVAEFIMKNKSTEDQVAYVRERKDFVLYTGTSGWHLRKRLCATIRTTAVVQYFALNE